VLAAAAAAAEIAVTSSTLSPFTIDIHSSLEIMREIFNENFKIASNFASLLVSSTARNDIHRFLEINQLDVFLSLWQMKTDLRNSFSGRFQGNSLCECNNDFHNLLNYVATLP